MGEDGPTHHGVFDLSYLRTMPGMTIFVPKDENELRDMLYTALQMDTPTALRYPRGIACDLYHDFRAPIRWGKSEILYDEEGIALIAVGSMLETAASVRTHLRDLGYSCSLINARFVKPLDEQCLMRAAASHRLIVTLEENVRTGGFGDHVLEFLNDIGSEVRVINIALPDEYIEHGSVDVLRAETGLDRDSILKRIIAEYAGMPQE